MEFLIGWKGQASAGGRVGRPQVSGSMQVSSPLINKSMRFI